MFEREVKLALISFRVLKADTGEIDRLSWVFRRPADAWAAHRFATFTFTGGAFCVRAELFQEAGGFWNHLEYSREEEDLAMELIRRDWKIVYEPSVAVRHYADTRGRVSIACRRYAELRNGILVLWRRFPVPIALLAISGRIGTMSLKIIVKDRQSLRELLPAVTDSVRDWRRHRLQRSPIGFRSAYRYALLHFTR
jgi:GT2 family glycosyltransferase